MTERAAVGEFDGIVVFELDLDAGREVEQVVACLRAGALAWEASPTRGHVDTALRPKDVQHVLDVAQEIEDEARRVHTDRETAYRTRAKAEAKEARRREREAKR